MQRTKTAVLALWGLGGFLILAGLIRGIVPVTYGEYTECGNGFSPVPTATIFNSPANCAAISSGPLLATWSLLVAGLLVAALALHADAVAARPAEREEGSTPS